MYVDGLSRVLTNETLYANVPMVTVGTQLLYAGTQKQLTAAVAGTCGEVKPGACHISYGKLMCY